MCIKINLEEIYKGCAAYRHTATLMSLRFVMTNKMRNNKQRCLKKCVLRINSPESSKIYVDKQPSTTRFPLGLKVNNINFN